MRRLFPVIMLLISACGTVSTPILPTPIIVSATQTSASPTAIPSTPTPIPPTDASTSSSSATAFPDPNAYQWQLIASGLQRPVDLQADGSGRLFILEKVGRIRILQNGQVLPIPFLDISDRVGSSSTEQGLLGLAFHPRYADNGRFFVNYTDKNGNTVIARFQVSADPNLADGNSEVDLLHIDQPFPNHNGGALAFGPDGYLYAGLGDGGSQGDPHGNGQNKQALLGKILRLDVDGGDPYRLPPDNPFGSEVWDYGFRNPWRISFDKATGDLYIGDVGQNAWEEIDYLPAGSPGGANFGWNFREGAHDYQGNAPSGLVEPVAEYSHNEGGCAVTGGYVYRGSMTKWNGVYFYGDYCTGYIWGVIHSGGGWQTQLLFETNASITSFGQDDSGEIYFVSDDGEVYQLKRK